MPQYYQMAIVVKVTLYQLCNHGKGHPISKITELMAPLNEP